MQSTGVNALVTGGAKRIGRAIVRDLAANGFGVAIHCSRSRGDAEKLAGEITDQGGTACVLQADLTDTAQAEALVDEAVGRLGPVQLVVNNASVFEDDSVEAFSEEVWDRHFAMHVKAPSIITGRFANLLPPEREGLVVNMIDQRVWRPTPRFFSYTLSKSALWTATHTAAQALGPTIRVNAIGPGPTLPNKRQEEPDFRRQTENLPLRRGPELSEFGATIRYLWETPSITGQMIALDGGQHLAWETPDVIGVAE